MVKGLWYRVEPYFAQNGLCKDRVQRGKAVYVHPKGRFAVLEFPGKHGRPRESFSKEELGEPVSAPREG